MTAWLDGIAIIAASHRIDPPGSTFVGAEEVFVDSSKAVPAVVAQPREQDLVTPIALFLVGRRQLGSVS